MTRKRKPELDISVWTNSPQRDAPEWRRAVYAPSTRDTFLDSKEWRKIRRFVFERDKHHCLRCDKRFSPRQLQAHHLIPRDKGGADRPDNLLTLCNPCHDFVEIHDLRTRAAIMGSMETAPAQDNPTGDYAEWIDWHWVVYGGQKRKGRRTR